MAFGLDLHSNKLYAFCNSVFTKISCNIVERFNPLEPNSFDTGTGCFSSTLVFPSKYCYTSAPNPSLKLLITARQMCEAWGSTNESCAVLEIGKHQERKVIVQASEGYYIYPNRRQL